MSWVMPQAQQFASRHAGGNLGILISPHQLDHLRDGGQRVGPATLQERGRARHAPSVAHTNKAQSLVRVGRALADRDIGGVALPGVLRGCSRQPEPQRSVWPGRCCSTGRCGNGVGACCRPRCETRSPSAAGCCPFRSAPRCGPVASALSGATIRRSWKRRGIDGPRPEPGVVLEKVSGAADLMAIARRVATPLRVTPV